MTWQSGRQEVIAALRAGELQRVTGGQVDPCLPTELTSTDPSSSDRRESVPASVADAISGYVTDLARVPPGELFVWLPELRSLPVGRSAAQRTALCNRPESPSTVTTSTQAGTLARF